MENPNNRIAEEGIPEERSEASVPEEANLTSAQAPAEPPMPEVDAARYAQPEIDSDDQTFSAPVASSMVLNVCAPASNDTHAWVVSP